MGSPKIFVSYRRGVDEQAAGRVADSLRDEFGRENVFLDVEKASAMAGLDFHVILERWVAECTDFVAVIGSGWIESLPRLHNDGDWVRTETANALARSDIRVVPLLVGEVEIPAAADLPDDLAGLPRRSGIYLSNANYSADVAKLIEALRPEEVLPTKPAPTNRDFWIWARGRALRYALAAVLLTGLIFTISYFNNEEFRHGVTCYFTDDPLRDGC